MVHHARGRHRSERDSWNSLRLFQFYRLGFALVLLTLFALNSDNSVLGSRFPQFFAGVSIVLIVVNLGLIATTFTNKSTFRNLVFITLATDVTALTLLIHASGGLGSGLGLILIVSVAGSSLLMPGPKAPFFAAVATLCLFGEQIYSLLHSGDTYTDFPLSAIHGGVLFTIAILAAHIAKKALSSEALADQRAQDLASLSALNENIVDRLQSGVVVIGFDQRVRLMNQSAMNLLDHHNLHHSTDLTQISSDLQKVWKEWAAAPAPRSFNFTDSGSGIDIECRFIRIGSGNQIATLAFLEDISQRRKQLQEIKLASLGRLTASIAHEIRNPLGSISHAAQLLEESENLDQGDERLVAIVRKNSERMNTLIEDILNLSRRSSSNQVEIELGDWLKSLTDEYLQHHSPDKALNIQLDLNEQQAKVDTNQLHQILWNLLANAQKYAKPVNEQLKLVIKLASSPDNKFAQIDIIDNGEPLAESTEHHLFEPFFTTSTEGTGLGLYISRELCQSNGGALNFMRAAQGGNCFRVRLPVAT